MKRFLVILFVFLLLGMINVNHAQRLRIPTQKSEATPTAAKKKAQPTEQPVVPTSGPRFAACDLCGFCPPADPPQSWLSCKKCLYPDIGDDPTTMESLAIDEESNLPPTPFPGKQYTFLGCIGGDGGGFTQEGSASGVVQPILNIVFSLAGGAAFLYLIYGSFIVVTSQADPEKLNYGRRLVVGSIVGLVFTLSSVLIVNFIASGVLKVPGFN